MRLFRMSSGVCVAWELVEVQAQIAGGYRRR